MTRTFHLTTFTEMNFPKFQPAGTIPAPMSRAAYWARRKELRAAYKAQQANADQTKTN